MSFTHGMKVKDMLMVNVATLALDGNNSKFTLGALQSFSKQKNIIITRDFDNDDIIGEARYLFMDKDAGDTFAKRDVLYAACVLNDNINLEGKYIVPGMRILDCSFEGTIQIDDKAELICLSLVDTPADKTLKPL